MQLRNFLRNPYNVASISNIVREAGIAKGSFYQYFSDKQDLYRYLLELSTEGRLRAMANLPTQDPSEDLFGYIRTQFQAAVYFELKEPGLAQVAYRAFVDEVPFPEMAEELRRRGPTQFFKQLLTQGIHRGEVSTWADVDLAAFILEATYYQFGRYFIRRLNLSTGEVDIDRIFDTPQAQDLLENLLHTLREGIAN